MNSHDACLDTTARNRHGRRPIACIVSADWCGNAEKRIWASFLTLRCECFSVQTTLLHNTRPVPGLPRFAFVGWRTDAGRSACAGFLCIVKERAAGPRLRCGSARTQGQPSRSCVYCLFEWIGELGFAVIRKDAIGPRKRQFFELCNAIRPKPRKPACPVLRSARHKVLSGMQRQPAATAKAPVMRAGLSATGCRSRRRFARTMLGRADIEAMQIADTAPTLASDSQLFSWISL